VIQLPRNACVLVLIGVVAGCASTASRSAVGQSSASATAAASSTEEASAVAVATPDPAIPTLTDEEALDAGTYRIDLDQVADTASLYPSVLITLPDGWNHGGWLVNKPRAGHDTPPIAVMFWDVDSVYGHACQWEGTLFRPGRSVNELANALADVPMRNATDPVDVTIGGYSGKYLEWSVPDDIEFDDDGNAVECDSFAGPPEFVSWTGIGLASSRYHQGAGQVDRVWILDVEGSRIVIDAFEMPYATAEEREELTKVVESIRFEP
jgi:uncharacterized protein YceK